MPIDTTNGPAWWVRTIFVVLFAGLLAGLEWGPAAWQNRWAAFSVGALYLVVALVFYGRQPDYLRRSRGFYLGFAILLLVFAGISFTKFFTGGKPSESTLAFVMLAFGFRLLYLFRLVSHRSDDLDIDSFHLTNHG